MTIAIVTAPEATALTTLSVVKAEIGITTTDLDTVLTRFINLASAQIVSYCDRDFALTTIDETIPAKGGNRIVLSRFPVTSITSVKYLGVAVDTDYYFLSHPEAGFLDYISTGSWEYTSGSYDYTVRYQYGYILPSFTTGTRNLPYDVEQACIELVKQAYFARDKDPSVAKEIVPQVYEVQNTNSVAGGSADRISIPASVITLLSPYKRYKLA